MEVIGFESNNERIIGRIHDNTSRRSVVSIVVPGGIGKTTLAKIIYTK
jgi:ABC-type cobalamin/Fe3+-siderophores transport system ATPase subunit